MKTRVQNRWPQLGGGVRHLVTVCGKRSEYSVTVEQDSDGAWSACVRGPDPPDPADADDVRMAAIRACR